MIGRMAMAAMIGGGLGAGAVSAVHLSRAPDNAAEIFAKRWMDLHTRCRTAMETAEPLDTGGLTEVSTLRRGDLDRDLEDGDTAWHGADNRIILIDHAVETFSEPVRACRLELADDAFEIHPDAVGRIMIDVLEERSALASEGTHYVSDPDTISPGFGVGYDAAAPNPDGCLTGTIVRIDPDVGIAQFISYEKSDLPCRERSQSTHHGASHA